MSHVNLIELQLVGRIKRIAMAAAASLCYRYIYIGMVLYEYCHGFELRMPRSTFQPSHLDINISHYKVICVEVIPIGISGFTKLKFHRFTPKD
jgi:hypothetical protein